MVAENITIHKNKPNARWWILAASSALLITALVTAVIYLVTKKPSIVDQLVIYTIPSGAEIKLDSTSYGTSPVKLEQVKVGTYTLTISKEGYDTIVEQITVSDSSPFEYKLKSALTPELAAKSSEERILEFQALAEDYFKRGRFANSGEESAMYYVQEILGIDANNTYANNKREQIRITLLQNAQSEMNRGALGSAKEYYIQLREYFPDDEEARAGASRLEALLSSKKGEVGELVRKAEAALRAGKLFEPSRSSAFYYAREALAIDNQNAQAQAVHEQIKARLLAVADQYRSHNDVEAEIRQLQTLNQNFPRDERIQDRLRQAYERRPEETVKTNSPEFLRQEGLSHYNHNNWKEAIESLEEALELGVRQSTEVLYALGSSHKELGHYDSAMEYLSQIPAYAGEQGISAQALMGDIEARRNNWSRALELYEVARVRGGSTLYSVNALNDKIENIEKRQRERAEAPVPVTISVKHPHAFGSCKGILRVDAGGVFYNSSDKSDDNFSYTLLGVDPVIQKNKLKLVVQGKEKTFEGAPSELERFRNALNKYKNAASKK